jgi:hypothetical protein
MAALAKFNDLTTTAEKELKEQQQKLEQNPSEIQEALSQKVVSKMLTTTKIVN